MLSSPGLGGERDRVRVREATASDAGALTSLVRSSAAYAGEYRRIVREVEVTAAYIARNRVRVAELPGGKAAGFYALVSGTEGAELDLMFVSDDARGLGVGRLLFEDMRDVALASGQRSVLIAAHPPAEGFYARMGAIKVGTQPPGGRASWGRPRMELPLA
jgi:GNAT superfamily N-acetyltransferase